MVDLGTSFYSYSMGRDRWTTYSKSVLNFDVIKLALGKSPMKRLHIAYMKYRIEKFSKMLFYPILALFVSQRSSGKLMIENKVNCLPKIERLQV